MTKSGESGSQHQGVVSPRGRGKWSVRAGVSPPGDNGRMEKLMGSTPSFPEEEALSSDKLSPELCKMQSSYSEEELRDELEELDISYLWTFDKKQFMDK